MSHLLSQKPGSRSQRFDRHSTGDGPYYEKNKRFGGLNCRDSIKAEVVPATRSKRKVGRVFRKLIELVDDGEIEFSDDLEAGKFPDGIGKSDLQDFYEFYQQPANDSKNLLHFAVKDSIESEDELYSRIALVKWLLRSCPDLFKQKNANHEEALSFVIAQYNVGMNDPAESGKLMSCDVNRGFAHYFLSEPSLESECRFILNQPTQQNRSKPHTAVKEMGVDIIPYLQLLNDSTLLVKDHDGNTPLHVALEVQHWREGEGAKGRVELVTKLTERCPAALTIMNRENGFSETMRMSPYRYHQSLCKKYHMAHKTCQNQSCHDVEFILKDAYMHLPDNQEAIKHLYNGNQGKLEQLHRI